MKTRTFKRLAVATAIAALGLSAVTVQAAVSTTGGRQTSPYGASFGGNIANTRHNLGSFGGINSSTGSRTLAATNTNMGDIFTTGTDQICVFCHTPHGSNTNISVPLWNKGTPASSYKAYTMGGNMATGTTDQGALNGTSSMSLACLTCHDGTQAMDNMMNAPGGAGWGGASGTRATVGNDGMTSYVWYNNNNTNSLADGSGLSADGMTSNSDTKNGQLQALPQVLGTDLSNDHPIGMVYGGGLDTAGKPVNPEFNVARTVTYGPGNTPKFFVNDAGVSVGWGDNSNFKLYGATMATAKVECGTCHDPHIDSQELFLRKNNAGSAVCLTCHIK